MKETRSRLSLGHPAGDIPSREDLPLYRRKLEISSVLSFQTWSSFYTFPALSLPPSRHSLSLFTDHGNES